MKPLIYLISLTSVSLLLSSTSVANNVQNAGKTIVSRGAVNAEVDQKSRKLKRRSPVYTNEKVVTGDKSSTQIRMVDGGLLSLQANSELAIVDYQFDENQQDGQVRLNLIKGGLRTVTGALTASAKKYQMQTPVASIGVRGTHYEAEIVGDNLFLAVWDGDIDVDVEVGDEPTNFSLGNNEDFSFASVQSSGEVKLMLEVPSVFSSGHSEQAKTKQEKPSEKAANAEKEQKDQNKEQSNKAESKASAVAKNEQVNKPEADKASAEKHQTEQAKPAASPTHQTRSPELVMEDGGNAGQASDGPGAVFSPETPPPAPLSTPESDFVEIVSNEEQNDPTTFTTISENLINEDLLDFEPTGIDVIAARVGTVTFGDVADLGSTSTSGDITNMSMSMNVDFDTGRIPEGELSFQDDDGRWFAAFDGVIGNDGLELNVNAASHGNEVAEGSLNGVFISDATKVHGDFALSERDDSSVTASGEFLLSEQDSETVELQTIER